MFVEKRPCDLFDEWAQSIRAGRSVIELYELFAKNPGIYEDMAMNLTRAWQEYKANYNRYFGSSTSPSDGSRTIQPTQAQWSDKQRYFCKNWLLQHWPINTRFGRLPKQDLLEALGLGTQIYMGWNRHPTVYLALILHFDLNLRMACAGDFLDSVVHQDECALVRQTYQYGFVSFHPKPGVPEWMAPSVVALANCRWAHTHKARILHGTDVVLKVQPYPHHYHHGITALISANRANPVIAAPFNFQLVKLGDSVFALARYRGSAPDAEHFSPVLWFDADSVHAVGGKLKPLVDAARFGTAATAGDVLISMREVQIPPVAGGPPKLAGNAVYQEYPGSSFKYTAFGAASRIHKDIAAALRKAGQLKEMRSISLH
ncbi:hypothetical protein HDU96_010804 [Phlyctochytrium bullatum]|nr:hypothetical protein HDU96_010804 [Phlyctochytrium bullatum]